MGSNWIAKLRPPSIKGGVLPGLVIFTKMGRRRVQYSLKGRMQKLRKKGLSPIKEEAENSWESFSESFMIELWAVMDAASCKEYHMMVGGVAVKSLLSPDTYNVLEAENRTVANQEGLYCLYCGVMGGVDHWTEGTCGCHGCPLCTSLELNLEEELQRSCSSPTVEQKDGEPCVSTVCISTPEVMGAVTKQGKKSAARRRWPLKRLRNKK